MSKSEKEKRYMEIARACIKAVNTLQQANTAEGDKSTAIEAVYNAIDKAFNKELADVQRELDSAALTLEQIRDTSINLMDAKDKASNTLLNLKKPLSMSKRH